jgi:hypothetical protein
VTLPVTGEAARAHAWLSVKPKPPACQACWHDEWWHKDGGRCESSRMDSHKACSCQRFVPEIKESKS